MHFSMALAALIGSATSTILWDGRFNDESISDLNKWSWSNQVGAYQYYIHGSEAIGSYLALDSSYKNPADSGSASGLKLTLDSTSYWNGQNMRRTELIPQTTAAIASGKVYYHFSIMHTATNPPSIYREHQIAFFESHFTELKSGWISGESGTSDPLLRWDISGNTHWSTNWEAGVWHNVAYGIDFSAGSVEFYHSTGSNPLTLTVPAVSVSASSNGADWHLGVLELPVNGQADATEDYYFSGVYIESGSITTNVAGPGGAAPSSSSSATSVDSSSPSSSSVVVSSVVSSSTSAAVVEPTSSAVEASSVASVASSAAVVESPSVVASSAVQAVSTSSALSVSSAYVAPAATSASVVISSSSKKSCTKAASSTAVAVTTSTKKPCTKAASTTASAISSFVTSKKKCSSVSPSSALFSASNVAIVSSGTAALTSATGSSIPHTTVTQTTTLTTQTTVSGTSTSASATSTGSAGTIAKWGQCGGTNWTGSGTCVSGTTCTTQNPYYSQCL